MHSSRNDGVPMIAEFSYSLNKKKTVFEATFINTTPWWGRGPDTKMVFRVGESKIMSLPTASTIVGKTRWVMATYLSPYLGMRRQVIEKVIADILGSTKASSKYRILVRSRYVRRSTGMERAMTGDTIRNELVAALASIKKRRRRFVFSEEAAPLPPGTVEVNLRIIRGATRPDAGELAEDFLIRSVIVAMIVYGIGSRANRGYGRFAPTAITAPKHFKDLFKDGVNPEGVVKLLRELGNDARELATHYSGGCDGCGLGMWPVPHVSEISDEILSSNVLYSVESVQEHLSPGELLGLISLVVHFIRKGLSPLPQYPAFKAGNLLGMENVNRGVLGIFSRKESIKGLSDILQSTIFEDTYEMLGIDRDSVLNSIAAHSLGDELRITDADSLLTYLVSQYVMGLPERLEKLESLLMGSSLDPSTVMKIASFYYGEGSAYSHAINELLCECRHDRECAQIVRKMRNIVPPRKWRKARRQSSLVFVPLCDKELRCNGVVLLYHYANDVALLLNVLEYVLRNDPMMLSELGRRVREVVLRIRRRLVGLVPLIVLLLKASIIVYFVYSRADPTEIQAAYDAIKEIISNKLDEVCIGGLIIGLKETIKTSRLRR